MTTPSGRATGRHSSDRQSSSTADPSTPQDEANWSISPHWTPTYTFSARWQMRARVIASTDVAASSSSAQAEASSIAADDDRPDAVGRVDAMTPRSPRRG